MSNSIWDEPEEREKMYFGRLELRQTHMVKGKLEYDPDHHDKDNPNRPEWAVDQWPDGLRPFWFIEMSIGPLNSGDLRPHGMYEFDGGWKKHTKPSIIALAKSGKLADADDINLKWVQYTYKSWEDYKTDSVTYYQAQYPDKVHADTRGNFYVEKKALFIVDVFSTEEECRLASDRWFGVEQPANNGGSPWGDVPAGNNNKAVDAILPFLSHFINEATDKTTGLVDRSLLAASIAGQSIFSQHKITIDSPEVVKMIQLAEMDSVPF